jgi:hypothetical protein
MKKKKSPKKPKPQPKPEHDMTGYRYLVEGDVLQEFDEILVDQGWIEIKWWLFGKRMNNLMFGYTKFFRRKLENDGVGVWVYSSEEVLNKEVKILTEDEFNNLLETLKTCVCMMTDLPREVRIEMEVEKESGDLLIKIDGLETEQARMLEKNFGDWLDVLEEEIEKEEKKVD